MHIGLVGLGKMGANMRTRLRERGVEVTGYDRNPEVSDVADLAALVAALPRRAARRLGDGAGRCADPQAVVDGARQRCSTAGDVVVEGGNSHYTDDHRARRRSSPSAGSATSTSASPAASGGWPTATGSWPAAPPRTSSTLHAGLRRPAARGPARGGLRARRRGRRRALREDGAQRHRVRPHAGLRRGLRAPRGPGPRHRRDRHPQGVDPRAPSCGPGCSTCWSPRSRRTRTSRAIDDWVEDSGEGRWTVDEAIDQAVPLPVISAALFARFSSRQVRLPRDEGRRGAAPAVRWPRGAPAAP